MIRLALSMSLLIALFFVLHSMRWLDDESAVLKQNQILMMQELSGFERLSTLNDKTEPILKSYFEIMPLREEAKQELSVWFDTYKKPFRLMSLSNFVFKDKAARLLLKATFSVTDIEGFQSFFKTPLKLGWVELHGIEKDAHNIELTFDIVYPYKEL